MPYILNDYVRANMTSFKALFSLRRILSFPYVVQPFKPLATNASYNKLRANRNFGKLILTQSRCLFLKTPKDAAVEMEIDTKKDRDLININNQKKSLPDGPTNLMEITKAIQNGPLDLAHIRGILFAMLNCYIKNKALSNFATEINYFTKTEEFETFAEAVEQSLPTGTIKYLFLVYEVMHYYKIPLSSILMQRLHALILDNINNFEVTQVLKMYLMIAKNDDKFVESLKKTFLAYMKYLTVYNLRFLGDVKNLSYLFTREEIPLPTRELLVQKVLSLGHNLDKLDSLTLTRLSYPLCSMEFQSIDKNNFFDALKKTLPKDFAYKNLNIVFENLKKVMREKHMNYDEELFDSVALGARQYELERASNIMKKLLQIGHVNYALADAIAEKFLQADLKSLHPIKFNEIVCCLGAVDYKNYVTKEELNNWLEVENVLKEFIEMRLDNINILTYLSLFRLGLQSKELGDKCLNDFAQILESGEEVSAVSAKRAYVFYQYYCSIFSSPPENLPENFVSNCLSKVQFSRSRDWEEAVYRLFQDEDCVLKNCKTPLGTVVSYALIQGPDRKFINLSSYKRPQKMSHSWNDYIELDQIEKPPDSKVFGFIDHGQELIKFRNFPLLRLEPRIITSIHKQVGYKICHLFSNRAKNYDDRVKILSLLMEKDLNNNDEDLSVAGV